MKRFWDEARVEPAVGGLAVLLDGRPVRLPGGGALRVEGHALAQALAAEWQAAGGAKGRDFRPEDIPLTRLVGTAQEKVAPDPAPMVEGIAQYAASDLLCYRSEDPRLAAIEALEWDPWLEWSARELAAPCCSATASSTSPSPRPHASPCAGRWRHAMPSPSPPWAMSCRPWAAWCWAWPLSAASSTPPRPFASRWSMKPSRRNSGAWMRRRKAPPAHRSRDHPGRTHAASGAHRGMKARHLLIAGRVQGVGFREWLVETARAHHLTGWVRNRADGRVEAVLAGEEPAIAAVLLLARRGPPWPR